MWLMLQQDAPDDYVIATGETRSLEEFVAAAFDRAGLDWHDHVDLDPTLLRPTDIAEVGPTRPGPPSGWGGGRATAWTTWCA
jgi:GDPmannose 4,6-dehydratase